MDTQAPQPSPAKPKFRFTITRVELIIPVDCMPEDEIELIKFNESYYKLTSTVTFRNELCLSFVKMHKDRVLVIPPLVQDEQP